MIASEQCAVPAWYLIHCKAKQDKRAQDNLMRQGYECYRPTYRRERLSRGTRQTLSESLFPGYLFIQLSLHDNWAPLRSTRGVLRTVSFGGQPVAIADEIIDHLQLREREPSAQPLLTQGDAVRINEGTLAELEALFMAMDGDERVVLLMNILQREQRINLPMSSITRL
ncbi:transcription/translation regulatory transformer protein RfaH [Pseudomonas sp. H11T01]|uniref:transcription/translation regulatory transformer protein RfaH n=1 Tax=Pseudomonas sp. H11T01 TaxID=3402749 RepID=UPI003AC92469